MLRPFASGRVSVFIDAANILYSQQTIGWRVDYRKLKEYIEHESGTVKMHFYTGQVGSNDKQGAFMRRLELLGFSVTAKEVKRIRTTGGTFQLKGNLDIELALDAYRAKDAYETILLLSGDSDFAYLLDLLIQEGKRIVVCSTRGHISKELTARGKYIDLQKLRAYIELK